MDTYIFEPINRYTRNGGREVIQHVRYGDETFDIRVYYHLGGMNYFTNRSEERGVYLSITPVQRSDGVHHSIYTYKAFSGIKELVHPVARFNKKVLNELVTIYLGDLTNQRVQNLFKIVLEKNFAKKRVLQDVDVIY